jgi:hypothetical protein
MPTAQAGRTYDALAAFFLLVTAHRFFCAAEMAARPAAESVPRRRRRRRLVGAVAVVAAVRRLRRRFGPGVSPAAATSGKARVIAAISARSSSTRARAPWAAKCLSWSIESDFAVDPPGE